MVERYLRFVRAVATESLGKAGVVLTTSSFITFVLFEIARLSGLVTNSYVGLIVYLLFPTLFVIGLLLIPIAWWRVQRRTGRSARELLAERLPAEELEATMAGAGVFRTIALLTLANVLILGIASARMLHFMDRAVFCGTACHSVMNPEWTTYQVSPHARVPCVECHVGEGVGALIDSKLNGMWQIVSATFDLYERPIPTPVHQLRPARETCEHCHWPEKFYGHRMQTLVHYAHDEASTPAYTTLDLKIDTEREHGVGGVHWHIAEANEVRYTSVGDEREEMIWVEVRRPDGSFHRYHNARLAAEVVEPAVRVMDCVDCHNRATHIYEDPERAVDERIRLGEIDRRLPYIKRESVAALTAGYPDRQAAMAGIEQHLYAFYRRNYPERAAGWLERIDGAVATLRDINQRNIHYGMNIRWGSYLPLIGHRRAPGCFRCHNRDLRDDEGHWIADGCTLCHSILADRSPEAFQFLEEPPEKGLDAERHRWLRREFLSSYSERG